MTGLAGGLQDEVHLGACDIPGVNPAHAFALQVDLEHDLGRRFPVLSKKSWMMNTTNSMGVKSSLSSTT